MTDFELEKLLSETLSTSYEPSAQLNKRIIDSVKTKPRFSYERLTAIAAALVIVAGGIIAGYSGNFYRSSQKGISPALLRNTKNISSAPVNDLSIDLTKSVAVTEEAGHLGDAIPTFTEWITITEVEITPQKAIFSLSEVPDDVTPVYTLEKLEDNVWNSYKAEIKIDLPQIEFYVKDKDFEIGRYRLCANSELGDTVYVEFEIN